MKNSSKNIFLSLKKFLGKNVLTSNFQNNEITLVLELSSIKNTLKDLRDKKEFNFKQLIDLCGVDYQEYKTGAVDAKRFAIVYHLLSLNNNQRIRIRVFADDNEFPVIPSITDLWPGADWYEREAFDLFGIMFFDHPDLRRILTDYGFIGHPFRKDFPMIGKVEVRYDPTKKRVIYEPVSIEERNNVPRIIRDEGIHNG